jgi:hypothetical protein
MPEPLTPREQDVYEATQRHPDWDHAQISRAVRLPPHVVRRYLQNIQEKLEGPPDAE